MTFNRQKSYPNNKNCEKFYTDSETIKTPICIVKPYRSSLLTKRHRSKQNLIDYYYSNLICLQKPTNLSFESICCALSIFVFLLNLNRYQERLLSKIDVKCYKSE